jgi:hypothetical protein
MTQNSFVRWAEAETEFAVGLKLDPNNADTWAMLSELMVVKRRLMLFRLPLLRHCWPVPVSLV